MKSTWFAACCLFLCQLAVANSSPPQSPLDPTAKEAVRSFYKSYLSSMNKGKDPSEKFLSEGFQKLIEKNKAACKKAKTTDVCGWGAGGDVFLDAQEIDPKLDYHNSEFHLDEPNPSEIKVTLNVYPSLKEQAKQYERTITFIMIHEHGRWVADDIRYTSGSARKQIQKEIASLKKRKKK